MNREGKKECLEYGHSKLNRNNKKTRKMFCPLWLNTAWIVSFEVLIIINFGRKESQMVHVLVQSSNQLLIQLSGALHELGITLDWVKYSEHEHINFLHMEIQCFCKTLSLPQHLFCGKVHIFWEVHKLLQNLHLTFDWHYIGQK